MSDPTHDTSPTDADPKGPDADMRNVVTGPIGHAHFVDPSTTESHEADPDTLPTIETDQETTD